MEKGIINYIDLLVTSNIEIVSDCCSIPSDIRERTRYFLIKWSWYMLCIRSTYWLTTLTVHRQTCRCNLTHYPDSETTNICSYSLMLHIAMIYPLSWPTHGCNLRSTTLEARVPSISRERRSNKNHVLFFKAYPWSHFKVWTWLAHYIPTVLIFQSNILGGVVIVW